MHHTASFVPVHLLCTIVRFPPNAFHPCSVRLRVRNVELFAFLPAALVYSEADFEVFRPAGATRCTDGVKFGLLQAKFHPNRCKDKGVGP